ISGLQGVFYKQFAVTIIGSTLISAFVSLTLSPALTAILLKPHDNPRQSAWLRRPGAPIRALFAGFDVLVVGLSQGYGWLTRQLLRIAVIVLFVYAGLIGFTYHQLNATPTGLIPQLDRGYLINAFQLPPGASLERTDEVIRRAASEILKHPAIKDAT